MVFEKAAKAAAIQELGLKIENVQKSHKRATQIMRAYKLDGRTRDPDAVKIVERIEAAHPTFAQNKREQLEYPWKAPKGGAHWPEKHATLARDMRDPEIRLASRVCNSARTFVAEVETVF